VGFSAEVLAIVAEEALFALKCSPVRIAYPDYYSPTSWALANHYYPTARHIAMAACKMMGKPTGSLAEEILKQCIEGPMDVPDHTFTGPF
jgi:hypothetical protein